MPKAVFFVSEKQLLFGMLYDGCLAGRGLSSQELTVDARHGSGARFHAVTTLAQIAMIPGQHIQCTRLREEIF